MVIPKFKLYLAGPLGFSEAGRLFHNSVLIPMLQGCGFEVLDPWTLTSQKLIDSALQLPYGQKKKEKWQKVNCIIGKNNADAIKESDILVAVLDGVDVDSGTASEIGYGSALGKYIIGYRGDFRLSADNEGSMVNLQVEYFIHKNNGFIVTNLTDLNNALTLFRVQYYSTLKS
ncbi:MAG: nucleoside 2-deoxyribosyltransferase [bacterium]|nr:nucleoside 2-deoxyribosyltransferase [bacterium]